MVDLANIGGIVAKYGNVFVFVLMWLFGAGLLVGLVYLIMRNNQFKHYTTHIYKRKKDKKGNETMIFCGIDKAAILMDRKLKKRVFKLKKNNCHLGEADGVKGLESEDSLDIPSLPSEKGGEIVFLEKVGPKKFAIANPLSIDGEIELKVTNLDIAEAIRAYDVNAKYYGGNEWSKWVGPIAFAVFAVLIIVLISVVLNKFEVLDAVSAKLVEAAKIVQSGRTSAIATNIPG